MKWIGGLLVALLALPGCGVVHFERTPTAPFNIALTIDGDVPLGTVTAGPLDLPVSEAFASTIVRLAKPYLIESGKFESCHYVTGTSKKRKKGTRSRDTTPDPAVPPAGPADVITVTATAECTLKGEVYTESLTLKLTPAPTPVEA